MPDLTATQIAAVQTVLERLCPNLALALSEQINCEAGLALLEVRTVPLADLLARKEPVVQTSFTFVQPEGSECLLVISDATGHLFVDLMEGISGGDPTPPLTDAQIDSLSGGMNGLVRGLSVALSNLTGENFDIEESTSTNSGTLTVPPVFALEGSAVEVKFSVTIPDAPEAELLGLFTAAFMAELALSADGTPGEGPGDAESLLGEDEMSAPDRAAPTAADSGARPPSSLFPDLPGRHSELSHTRGLEMILDIPLDVTVELGRVRMLIKDVLELSSGSIIELDRVAGEPVDLVVNGRLVAKGEVVVIEDNFGLRITEIVSPAERVAGLGRADRR
jgi:flagellar motor switch protein FliN